MPQDENKTPPVLFFGNFWKVPDEPLWQIKENEKYPETVGWYFSDEIYNLYGPYSDREIAEAKLKEYYENP